MSKTIQIADTIHGSIKLNNIEKQIISTPIFNRLHNISQNSTAYLTFPSNRTKRFEHSVGCMHLSGKMFFSSITNAEYNILTDFFSAIKDIISQNIISNITVAAKDLYRSKLGDSNFQKSRILKYKELPINPQYNDTIPINVLESDRILYVILFQSLRLSALLHDVGHPPFSHISETALKNLWNELNVKDTRNERENSCYECLNTYFSNNQELHEKIGNNITKKLLETIIENFTNESSQELFNENLFKILIREFTLCILTEGDNIPTLKENPISKNIFVTLHRIIGGALDCDRLDYVCRDPLNSGLSCGKIEYDRLITSTKLIEIRNSDNIIEQFSIAFPTKIVDAIEDFFDRRWNLYKRVIHHHRVIKTDYLLENCIQNLSEAYLKKNDPPANLDESILPYDISGLWLAVEENPSNHMFFYSLIQWDDNWLLTILKKLYFIEYACYSTQLSSNNNSSKTIIAKRLEELIANKKYYYSLIKRANDFKEIDKNFFNIILSKKDSILVKIKKYNQADSIVIKKLSDFFNTIQSNYSFEQHGFFFNRIKKLCLSRGIFTEDDLKNIFDNVSNHLLESLTDISDLAIVSKKMKTGIQEGLMLYHSDTFGKDTIISFDKFSKKGTELLNQLNFLPPFYVYVLKKHQQSIDYNYIEIKRKLGDFLATIFIDAIFNQLDTILSAS